MISKQIENVLVVVVIVYLSTCIFFKNVIENKDNKNSEKIFSRHL
jgi:hypothetical protein